jgi:hypothetical protein
MANGSLERRVTKLEKTGGGVVDFDSRLRKYCANQQYDYDFVRNAVKGHEAEIHITEDGLLTYESFQTIYRCRFP